MDSESHHQLHVFFFPLMAYGHMIPTIDIARLFAARGVKATIIITPLNASITSKSIDRDRLSGLDIHIQIIQFPSIEAGLPQGIENLDEITSPELIHKFNKAVKMLQQPLEQLLEQHHPDFIIADMFLPWVVQIAAKFGIPRIVFHGTSFFSLCISESLRSYRPSLAMTSEKETIVVPGLPDKIKMTMTELPDFLKTTNEFTELMELIRDSELKSYGAMINSFYELEPSYAEHYRKVMGRRAWHIGPVSLRNKDTIDKAQRGKKSSIDDHYVLSWLDSKKPNSVLYVCFGSISRISSNQLLEIAMGLEDSGFSFVWVVKMKDNEDQKFLPDDFEERMEGKGLIIRGWAPQVLILDHPAVGGFITHCGWNSIFEGVTASVPMITWPLFAEQFFNEKLVTQVLKIGIRVRVEQWNLWTDQKSPKTVLVKKEKIEKVVTQLMGDGEEAEDMRRRAKELSEMAKRAVEEGGSSYADLTSLIKEMKMYKKSHRQR